MKSPSQSQLKQEYESWKKNLELFRQENALLKYRLSEMVDKNEGIHFLQTAEYFQNEFLLIDDKLKNLFKTIHEFSELFSTLTKEQQLSGKITAEHNKLRKGMLQLEKKIMSLTKDFNTQMLEGMEH